MDAALLDGVGQVMGLTDVRMRTTFQRFAILALALFAVAQTAVAQNATGVTMQPTLIDERVEAGEVIEGAVRVRNESNVPETYELGVHDVSSVNDRGQPVFANAARPPMGPTVSEWIELDTTQVTVDPGEQQSVGYTIVVPQDAPPGGHFAGIYLRREADPVDVLGAGVGFEVATLTHIQVNGDVIEDLDIRELSTQRSLYLSPRVQFETRVQNEGSVLSRPRGTIEITDMLGNQVAVLVINENAGGIVPGSDRVFVNVWEEDGLRVGRFEALASLSYGQQVKKTVTRGVTFWVVPFVEIGVIALAAIAVLFVLWGGMRWYVRREMNRAGLSRPQAGEITAAPAGGIGSRIAAVVIAVLVIALLFLMGLFIFFA